MQFRYLIAGFLLFHSSNAFSFTAGQANQCDNLSLSWTGGQPPFQLLMTPVFGTPRNVSIPASAQGSFSTQIPFPKGKKILLTMSDATGFGSGGTTNLITVGASTGGNTCDTADPAIAFSFQLNAALQQCRPYTISGYTGASQPVTIMALIPGGQPTVLTPPTGSQTFDWVADVQAGTSMIFTMVDSQGRTGGSSNVETVGASNDKTCLTGSSPSSTFVSTPASSKAPSKSASKTATRTSSASAKPSKAAGTSAGTVVGAVLGTLVALAALVAVGFVFLKRRYNTRPFGEDRSHRHSRRLQSIDNLYYQSQSQMPNSESFSSPFRSPIPITPASAAYSTPRDPSSVHDPWASPAPPQTLYNAVPSVSTPQSYAAHDINPETQPITPQAPYDVNRNMHNLAPQVASSVNRNAPSLQPSYNANSQPPAHMQFDAGAVMRQSLHQPPFDAVPHGQLSPPQKTYPYGHATSTQRPPSPSLLAYDADPDAPSEELPTASSPPPRGIQHSYAQSFSFSQVDTSGPSMSTSARQKAAEAGQVNPRPARFVLHTDADELQPDDEGVIELPPRYTDRRAPSDSPQPHDKYPPSL